MATTVLPPIDGQPVSEPNPEPLTVDKVLSFCFPERTLEGDSPLGRLELLARFGPLDANGQLRGGRGGGHVLTAGEVRQMAYDLHARRWSRKLKRDFVDDLVPYTLGIDPRKGRSVYGHEDVRALLHSVAQDSSSGNIDLARFQDIVLKDVQRRFRLAFQAASVGKPLNLKLNDPVKELAQAQAQALAKGKETKEPDEPPQHTIRVSSLPVSAQASNKLKSKLRCLAAPSLELEKPTPKLMIPPAEPPRSDDNRAESPVRDKAIRALRRKELRGMGDLTMWGSQQLSGSISRSLRKSVRFADQISA